MEDDEILFQIVSTDVDSTGAVADTHTIEKRKKKKDYKNRAKWKIRKEMKQQVETLELEPEEIVKEYIDIHANEVIKPYIESTPSEVVKPYIEFKKDVIKEYIESVQENSILEKQPDVVRDYIELHPDVVREYIELYPDVIREYIEPKQDIVKDYIEFPSVEVQPDVVREYLDTTETVSSISNAQPVIAVQPTVPSPSDGDAGKVVKSETSTYDIRRVYINFQTRVAVLITGILLMFGVACYLIISTLQQYEIRKVHYYEKTTVHYEVCQDSSTSCLNENTIYQANKISKINVQYQYDAQFDESVDCDLSYYVVAVHKIFDRYDAQKTTYEQEETITKKEVEHSSGDHAQININAEVDFPKYYSFVENYKKKYSEISYSTLKVTLYIDDGSSSHMAGEVSIPLASEQFSIVKKDIDNAPQEYSYNASNWSKNSGLYLVVGCILVLLSLFLLIRLTRLVLALAGKKSKYQEYLKIILNEYDRLIVNAKDKFEVNPNKKLIKVYTFDELLEIRGVLNKPIIFIRINSVKSEFIVEDEEVIYKFILKEADMGE